MVSGNFSQSEQHILYLIAISLLFNYKTVCNCGLTHCVRDWGVSELFGAKRTDSVQDDVRVSDYRE